MIKRIAREVPLFESLGLFTEAPKKKRKPRVISVRPIRKDYVNDVEPDELLDIDDTSDDFSDYDDLGSDMDFDMDDLENFDDEVDIVSDPETEPDLGIDDFDSFLADNDVTEDDAPDVNENEPEESGEIIDATDGTGEPEDTTSTGSMDDAETQSTDVSDTSSEEDVDGEVLDATAGGGEDPEASGDIGGAELDDVPEDGTDPAMDQTSTDPTTTDPAMVSSEPVTKDDVRKYELFKRFMNLYKSIQYFIDKLENGISDSERFEYASTKALAKFKSLEELMKDYMILKFQTDSYLQNSFFYEKIKASCLLVFELIKNNKNKNSNN